MNPEPVPFSSTQSSAARSSACSMRPSSVGFIIDSPCSSGSAMSANASLRWREGTKSSRLTAVIASSTRKSDRKSDVLGKSVSVRVDYGGCSIIKKKQIMTKTNKKTHLNLIEHSHY